MNDFQTMTTVERATKTLHTMDIVFDLTWPASIASLIASTPLWRKGKLSGIVPGLSLAAVITIPLIHAFTTVAYEARHGITYIGLVDEEGEDEYEEAQ